MGSRFNKLAALVAAALCMGMIFLSGCGDDCDDCDASVGFGGYGSSDAHVEHALFDK